MAIVDNNNVLLIANDNTLELNGLRNATLDYFVQDALVAAELRDMTNNPVAGQDWPVSLDYVPDSNGVYRTVLENTLVLSHEQHYKLHIAAQGDGLTGSWEAIIKAQIRRK